MSTHSSSTTPKAKPTEAAVPSPSFPLPDTLDPSEFSERQYREQDLSARSSGAQNLEASRVRVRFPPRGSNEGASAAPGIAPYGHPHETGNPARSHAVAPDGGFVRSAPGFKAGTVPGNYRSPFDYNMEAARQGALATSYNAESYDHMQPATMIPRPLPEAQTANGSGSAASVPYVQVAVPQVGTPQRLVLLGPLRMIRSQCARKEVLQPILVWIDQHMGEQLRTPAYTDQMIPNLVYAVNIPMNDQHWQDWNKVLAVFPRAAAWQQALTPEEPFDQVTQEHPTSGIFRSGKKLDALLVDLVKMYNLGLQHDVNRPWDLPGQTEWMSPMAREALARR